jgi:hypothetical protein
LVPNLLQKFLKEVSLIRQ